MRNPACCVHGFQIDSEEGRLLNFYLPGAFERVIKEFVVPAKSHVIPLKSPATPEQIKALFQRVGMNAVALPDSLREAGKTVNYEIEEMSE